MAFLIVVVCCIAGFVVGGIGGNDATVGFGFFAGLAFGIVFARLRTLSARIESLKREVAGTTDGPRSDRCRVGTARGASAACSGIADRWHRRNWRPPSLRRGRRRLRRRRSSIRPRAAPPPRPQRRRPLLRRARPRPLCAAPPPPNAVDNLVAAIKRWFTEGNVPVKVGMLVLFAGVAALLEVRIGPGLAARSRSSSGSRASRSRRSARWHSAGASALGGARSASRCRAARSASC